MNTDFVEWQPTAWESKERFRGKAMCAVTHGICKSLDKSYYYEFQFISAWFEISSIMKWCIFLMISWRWRATRTGTILNTHLTTWKAPTHSKILCAVHTILLKNLWKLRLPIFQVRSKVWNTLFVPLNQQSQFPRRQRRTVKNMKTTVKC